MTLTVHMHASPPPWPRRPARASGSGCYCQLEPWQHRGPEATPCRRPACAAAGRDDQLCCMWFTCVCGQCFLACWPVVQALCECVHAFFQSAVPVLCKVAASMSWVGWHVCCVINVCHGLHGSNSHTALTPQRPCHRLCPTCVSAAEPWYPSATARLLVGLEKRTAWVLGVEVCIITRLHVQRSEATSACWPSEQTKRPRAGAAQDCMGSTHGSMQFRNVKGPLSTQGQFQLQCNGWTQLLVFHQLWPLRSMPAWCCCDARLRMSGPGGWRPRPGLVCINSGV